MFGMIAMHSNDKIKKDMQRLHVKSRYHAKKRQKISQCGDLKASFIWIQEDTGMAGTLELKHPTCHF